MTPSGIATIYTPRRFYILMRRTAPLNPLNQLNLPNLFRMQSKGDPSYRLTPNPEPRTLNPIP